MIFFFECNLLQTLVTEKLTSAGPAQTCVLTLHIAQYSLIDTKLVYLLSEFIVYLSACLVYDSAFDSLQRKSTAFLSHANDKLHINWALISEFVTYHYTVYRASQGTL